jgi:hypothetical protein
MRQERKFRSVVHLWKHYVEGHYNLSRIYSQRAVLIRYEDLIAIPAIQAERIVDTFGLKMDGGFNASTIERSQKAYDHAMNELTQTVPGIDQLSDDSEARRICTVLGSSKILRELNYLEKCPPS